MKSFLQQKFQHKQSKTTDTLRENIFQKLMSGLKNKPNIHIYVNQKIKKIINMIGKWTKEMRGSQNKGSK